MATRNPLPARAHLPIVMNLKSHFAAKIPQQVNISCRLVPEVEVVAFMNFAGMQPLLQNSMSKLVRRHEREIAREGKEQDRIDTGGFQQTQFFRKRRDRKSTRLNSSHLGIS